MSPNVKLASSDEQEFEVEKGVAEMSVTIKNMLEGSFYSSLFPHYKDMDGLGSDTVIPLPNVTGKILETVIVHCKYHLQHPTLVSEDEKRTDDIILWDQEFCKVDQATLFELILVFWMPPFDSFLSRPPITLTSNLFLI